MPTILRRDGFRIFFFSNEGDPREPAHVHVRRGAEDAKIWSAPEIVVAESFGFNARELNDLLRISFSEHANLLRAWHDYFS